MSEKNTVTVTLPADVQQLDATGYVWAFLDTAAEPDRVRPGALIVAGDSDEPFLARVVDIVEGPGGRSIVHLDVVGVPDQAIDELRHARLLPQ
ncbi:MAG TPA: hypothetical protein VFU14_17435 [Acidimicrobiales bacterium]|nr:hypothetical protein [Acidimicrobiales bacterium]